MSDDDDKVVPITERKPQARAAGRLLGSRDKWMRTHDKDMRRFFANYRLLLEKKGKSPVQIMVQAMIEVYDEHGAKAAFPYAERVAPYLYSKLATLDIRQQGEEDENKQYVISSGAPMSREQWLQMWANPGQTIEGEVEDGTGTD